MLRKLLSLAMMAGMALSGFGANAQTVSRNWCGTDAEQERYYAAHPGSREARQAYYQQLEALAQNQQRGAAYVTDVTIPVVVHVLHAGGVENISDRQINSAINQLNIDYQKLNPDTVDIISLFRPIAASVGFRFRLAKKDPNGNCTTGITRHYVPAVYNDAQNGSVHATGVWDQARYLNIWVVNSISSGAAGYVTPPNLPTNARDGFVVLHDYFGTQGTSTLFKGRAATHEVGHYFGLSHTWGGTNTPGSGNCNGTDNVPDTPPTDGSQTCNLSYAPCGQVTNVQNFMDYSYCFRMFTQGQRALMRTILASNRSVLTSQANLVATGTNDGYVAPDCAPLAAFAALPG
ncbi:M43 family zinc metalloprotease, partial [Hymenobacter negativus]